MRGANAAPLECRRQKAMMITIESGGEGAQLSRWSKQARALVLGEWVSCLRQLAPLQSRGTTTHVTARATPRGSSSPASSLTRNASHSIHRLCAHDMACLVSTVKNIERCVLDR